VQRPSAATIGAPAGEARASVVADLSTFETERVLEKKVKPDAYLMSDELKAFVAVGRSFAARYRPAFPVGNMCVATSAPTLPRASIPAFSAR
jgi:hypothetical protein